MRTKIKLFCFLIVILFVGIGIYFLSGKFPCQRLTCLSLKDRDQYKIKNIYEENKYIFRALWENGDNLLKTEIRTDSTIEEANQAIQVQLARTKGIFEDAAAPYPGEISDIISCGQEYQPKYSVKEQNGIRISYFTGFVNERLVFGACTADQAIYRDTLAMFYCDKQRKFYQIEIIIPNKDYPQHHEEYQQILDSIACAK